MVFLWGTTAAAAMAAKLERLRDAERALIQLAFQQNTNTSSDATYHTQPEIQSIDTLIPVNSISNSDAVNNCLVGTTDEKNGKNCYVIHSISVSAQNVNERADLSCSERPLVLLHGYSTYFLTRLIQRFHFLCDVWSTYFVLSIDVLAFLSRFMQ
jgi:hypothetical protein